MNYVSYVPALLFCAIPLLVTWWTYRRMRYREYLLLISSLMIVCGPLLAMATKHQYGATQWSKYGSLCGILLLLIPLSVVTTAAVTAIPTRMVFLRGFLAILLGEVVLLSIAWIT